MAIQLKRDTAANWTSANPVLAAGQPGFESDTNKFKIGDGSTAWASLSYISGTVSSETIDDRVAALIVAGSNMTITYNDVANTLTFDATGSTYTDEMAQDAIGVMVGTSLVYNDAGATLQRAALTGAITAPQDSNATSLGSFTKAQLDTAVSDGNVQFVGDAPTAHTHLLAAGATDVTITATNLNILDDGVNTTLHFHDSDRNRTNHTGTQLSSTISDFNEAAQDAVGAMVDSSLVYTDATPLLQRAALTGDVTASAGSNATTISNDAVSFAKMQNSSGASVLVGRGAGAGAGDFQEISLGTNLSMSGTTLNATGGGGSTFSDASFTLQDDVDATKQAQFQLSGLTTATTRTYTLPDVSGTLTAVNSAHTITSNWTFTANNGTFGSGTGASTYNLGTGVTTTGVTKAVNVGTAGASGSTTNIQIGSATAGALGTTTINSQTVAFGATVTAINLPDVSTFLVDNTDATKKAQFELSGLTTATTRTLTIPDANGTIMLTNTGVVASQMPALTGDVTTTAGSVATSLATVNANVGSFGSVSAVATFTVNAKGLITAAGSSAISIASTAISDLSTAIMTLANTQTVTGDKTFTGAVTVTDSVFGVVDNLDPTKIARLQVSGLTTATTRTYSLPDIGGAAFVMDSGTQSIAGIKTFTGTLQVADTNFVLQDDVDSTKKAKFVLDSITTGTTRSYTLPDVAASTIVVDGGTQTIGGAKTLTNASVQDNNFNIFDNLDPTKKVQFQASGLTTGTTRTITVPDADGTLAYNTVFTSVANGLTPLSGGGTTNFLRADGTWAVPAGGGGGGSPGGSTTQMQYNSSGAFAGATEVLVENDQLRLAETTSLTAPAASGVKLLGQASAGRTLPAFLSQDGTAQVLQPWRGRNYAYEWRAIPGASTLSAWGGASFTAVGTASASTPNQTNIHTHIPRVEYQVTVAATTAIAGFRTTTSLVTVGGSVAGFGGFHFVGTWGPSTGVATTTNRAFFGLAAITSAPTDVEPSTAVNCVFMGWDAADTNIQMMRNDATGTCTKIDLGASFPVPTADRTSVYELEMYSPKGTTQIVYYRVKNLGTGALATGSFNTDLPTTTTAMSPRLWMSVGGTSSVIGVSFYGLWLDPLV